MGGTVIFRLRIGIVFVLCILFLAACSTIEQSETLYDAENLDPRLDPTYEQIGPAVWHRFELIEGGYAEGFFWEGEHGLRWLVENIYKPTVYSLSATDALTNMDENRLTAYQSRLQWAQGRFAQYADEQFRAQGQVADCTAFATAHANKYGAYANARTCEIGHWSAATAAAWPGGFGSDAAPAGETSTYSIHLDEIDVCSRTEAVADTHEHGEVEEVYYCSS